MRFYLLFLLMVLAPLPAHSFYKCTDEAGAVTYQKIQCRPASTQNKMHVYIPPKPDAVLGGEFPDDDDAADGASESESALSIKDNFSTIMSSLAPVKMAVLEYYRSMNKWPKSLADIGMNATEMTSSYVDGVSLDSSGKVVARLNRGFGQKKQLILEPKNVMGGTSFEWKCYANFPKNTLLSGGASMCESKVID